RGRPRCSRSPPERADAGTAAPRAAVGAVSQPALSRAMFALFASARSRAAWLARQSLTVLYRVLCLLFAEARGLVPLWHPVYRERYSLESIVAALLDGRPYQGAWRAVHASSRLAHV